MVALSFREEALQHLLAMIDSGEIKIGDKVPGQRELAEILRMSRGATSQALMDLKKMGVTVSRGRAGTFLSKLPEDVKATESDNLVAEYMEIESQIARLKKLQQEVVFKMLRIAKGTEE